MALMYSKQDQLMTAEQLAAVPTPAPLGRFHQPVGFGDFLELVKHRLDRAGIDVRHEEYVTTPDQQTFFGAMQIAVDGFDIDGVELTLGIRGSHNQKVPRGLCLGNRVIVCSNLMFNGDMANMVTKQTTNVWNRLPAMVDSAVSKIPQLSEREAQRIDQLKLYQMQPRWGDAALVELHRRSALTAAQLGRAISEWDRPSYAEHAEDGFTAWRLLNAVTEANKPTGEQCNMELVRQRTALAADFIGDIVAR